MYEIKRSMIEDAGKTYHVEVDCQKDIVDNGFDHFFGTQHQLDEVFTPISGSADIEVDGETSSVCTWEELPQSVKDKVIDDINF